MSRMWRFVKWFFGCIVVALLLAVLFRGPLFRALFHFERLREVGAAVSSGAPRSIATAADDAPPLVLSCVDAALDETAAALSFTVRAAPNTASGARARGHANCVSYAALFQQCCEQRLAQSGLADDWRVLHLRGLLHCGDFNTHRLFSSPFWKDHDICAVELSATGQRFFVDPSLYDMTGIRRVAAR
jgi:hypothetical protein